MSIAVAHISPELAVVATDSLIHSRALDGSIVRRTTRTKLINVGQFYCAVTGLQSTKDDVTGDVTFSVRSLFRRSVLASNDLNEVIDNYSAVLRNEFTATAERCRADLPLQFSEAVAADRFNTTAIVVGVHNNNIAAYAGYYTCGLDSENQLNTSGQPLTECDKSETPLIYGINSGILCEFYRHIHPDWQSHDPLTRVIQLVATAIRGYPEDVGWPIQVIRITPNEAMRMEVRKIG